MAKRTLGSHGPEVSEIGLGCMGMSAFYGSADEAESRATIDRALDLGCTFLDTSDMYGPHTNERLDIVYRRSENYLPEALAELDHYLRDHRTGEVRHFDPHLFDLLYDLTASVNDFDGEIDVVCGYRTPWSNEFLSFDTRASISSISIAE